MRINLGRLTWQTWIGTVVKYPNRVMRFGLGMVIYRIGDCFVADTELKHSQGFSKLAEFPTVLDKSLLVFYAVLSDLRNCGGPFLDSDSSQFVTLSEWCAKRPKPTGFNALSNQ